MTEPPEIKSHKSDSSPQAQSASSVEPDRLKPAANVARPGSGGPSRTQSTFQSSWEANKKLLDNRWFVLGAIFLAMMFLGLPLLWRCPAFSKLEKFIWTIVVLIYSAAIFWVFFLVMSWSWQRIQDSL